MKIILLGFMGSGKSVFGKRLAKRLNIKFFDLDKHIEQNYRMTIPSIFSTFDETVFRNIEKIELVKILKEDSFVLSCGGGTPCFNNNIDTINDYGLSIYIELDQESLVERLSKSRTKRPLITGLKQEELANKVSELLKIREKNYKQAHITVNGNDINLKDVIQQINTK